MEAPNRYAEALRAAAETAGGEGKLASLLGVSAQDLHAWLEGRADPPLSAFLDSLDIIADGPFGPRPRRVRVVVLRETTT